MVVVLAIVGELTAELAVVIADLASRVEALDKRERRRALRRSVLGLGSADGLGRPGHVLFHEEFDECAPVDAGRDIDAVLPGNRPELADR